MSTWKMRGLFWILFYLVPNFECPGSSNTELKTTRRVHHLDGFLANSTYLQQYTVNGNLMVQCGVRCDVTQDCRSYFVDSVTSRCQLHNNVLSDVSGMTESEGSYYFRKASECPDGWLVFDNSCYLFTNSTMNFDEAKAFCRDRGASLPSLESEAENNFLKTFDQYVSSDSRGPWIGITDIQQQGTWVWDATGETPSFTDWDDGQPQINGERCAVMYKASSYKWHDIGCSTLLIVVCEM